MTCKVSLELLEKHIDQLREELESKVEMNINDLSSPEVLGVNNKIDKLLVAYLKETLKK